MAVLERLFERQTRLITITGPGGVGKTRLAEHFLHQSGRMPTPCCFVDASECHQADDLVLSVAESLGLGTINWDDPAERLGLILSRRGPIVLFLDNLEQLAKHAAGLVFQWLSTAPEAIFLVTSRGRLNLTGETLLELKPFSSDQGEIDAVSEAAELFIDRRLAVDPEFEPSAADITAIHHIVECVDGLPLAIELAAARSRLLGTDNLRRRLAQSFDVLKSKVRDRPERHRTLHNTLQWSWKQLPSELRTILGQLAVFEGRFTLDDATGVLATSCPDVDPIEAVESLREVSLILECTGGFRLLRHIRRFAWTALEDTEQQRGALAHASYFKRLAERRLMPRDWTLPLRLERTERANYDAVLERAAQFGRKAAANLLEAALWICQVANPHRAQTGSVERFAATTEKVLECAIQSAGIDPSLLFDASLALARTLRVSSRIAAASTVLDRAGQWTEEPIQKATVWDERSRLLWMQKKTDEAIELATNAATSFEKIGEELAAATAQAMVAAFYHEKTQFDRSKTLHNQALNVFRRLGAGHMEAMAATNLAWTFFRTGDFQRARGLWLNAVEQHRDAGNHRFVGNSHMALGRLAAAEGDVDSASDLLFQATGVHHEIGDLVGEMRARYELSQVALLGGNIADARARLSEVTPLAQQLNQRFTLQLVELDHALADWLDGHPDQAIERLEIVLRTGEYDLVLPYRPHPSAYLGAIHVRLGNHPQAKRAFETADGDAQERSGDEVVDCLNDLLRAFGHRGEKDPEDEMKPLIARAVVRQTHPAPTAALAERRIEVRLLLRLLWDTLEPPSALAIWASSFESNVLVASRRELVIRIPNGEIVDLRRQPLLGKLLLHLAERRRVAQPGISTTDIRELLWPGEQIIPSAAKNRVLQCLNRVKKLGLAQQLKSGQEGYRLTGPIALVPEAFLSRSS